MNNVVGKSLFALMIASLLLLLGACSINVDDKDKKDGKVDIQTPFANLKAARKRPTTESRFIPGPTCVPRTRMTLIR